MATVMLRINSVAGNGGFGKGGYVFDLLVPWDWVILSAMARRFRQRPRGYAYEIAVIKDARANGTQWQPAYPMGKIAAAVTCDIMGLWR